jgi:FG-GAP repeat protein
MFTAFTRSRNNVLLTKILTTAFLFAILALISAELIGAAMVTNSTNPMSVNNLSDAMSKGFLNMSINSSFYNNASEKTEKENDSDATLRTRQNNTIPFKFSDGNENTFSSNVATAANVVSSSNALTNGPSKITADFNGDGYEDKAIGVPGEGISSLRNVGAVNVIYGSASGLSAIALLPDQLWTQNSTGMEGDAELEDYFGYSLSAGDYNGDGKDDLAVGVPGESIGILSTVGAVNIIYGSDSGLSANALLPTQFWTQDSTGIEDDSEPRDAFGWSLSSGDYNGDGKDDLAVGVPQEDIGILSDVGSVNIIYGSASGLSAHPLLGNTVVASQLWNQNSNGVQDNAETGEWFGYSLSSGDYNADGNSDLAVGVPLEDISVNGIAPSTGAVHVVYGSATGLTVTAATQAQFWTQNSSGMEGIAEGDDYFGYSLSSGNYNGDNSSNSKIDDLLVGVPGEDIDANNDGIDDIINGGAVNVIYGSSSGLSSTGVSPVQFWTQNSTGMEGDAEIDDLFGFSFASGDYNGDGNDDIAIGVPREDMSVAGIGGDTGAVNVIYGSALGLSTIGVTPAQFWTQNSTGIQGIAELNDNFGWSLSSGDYNGDGKDDIAIGVPQEDVDLEVGTLQNFDNKIDSSSIADDTGVVQVIYGSGNGLSATAVLPDQVLRQGFANIEELSEGGDFFGYSS